MRDSWGSKLGFILATAGSAVGLGNIWRFPYLAGQNGGGAFLLVYLLCVLFIGIPLIFSEIAFGRYTAKNPIGAFTTTGGRSLWAMGGVFSLAVSFFVLSYYGVIAGWTLGYIFISLFRIPMSFTDFLANPYYNIGLFGVFMLLNILTVRMGVAKGIEKISVVLMPMLFVILIAIIVRGLTLPGSSAGLAFYLIPDFSKITGATILKALGQSFFSLSIGWGILITYGSYLSKKENIVTSSLWVAGMDTSVAVLGGLMVFPAVFAFGFAPDQGTTLAFNILPKVFDAIPWGGNIIGALFFLLLLIAAFTSTLAMIEVPGSYLMDEWKWSREKSTWVIGIAAFVIGIPSCLSSGASAFWTNMEIKLFGDTITGFLNILDTLFGTVLIVLAALIICIYVGWKLGIQKIVAEIQLGAPIFQKPIVYQTWVFFIRFICPIIIGIVFFRTIGIIA